MKNYLPQLIPSTFVETKHFVMGCPTLDLAFLTLQVMKGYIWNTGSSSVLPCSSHIPSSKGSGMRLGMASFPSHVEWPGNEARPGIVVLTKHSGSICTQPCRIQESNAITCIEDWAIRKLKLEFEKWKSNSQWKSCVANTLDVYHFQIYHLHTNTQFISLKN